MFQLTNIYIVSLLLASASTNYLYLSIPNELLIHGPIVLNVTNTKLTAKPIVCNPHFELFRNNYLSEEIKNQEEVELDYNLLLLAHSQLAFATSLVGHGMVKGCYNYGNRGMTVDSVITKNIF